MIPSLDIEVKALAERARDYGEPVEWIGTIVLKEVIGGPLVCLHGTREDFRELAAALYALTGTGPDESDERREGEFEREAIRDKNAGRGEIAASMTTLGPIFRSIFNGPERSESSSLLDSAARSLVDGEPVLATAEEISEALEASHE